MNFIEEAEAYFSLINDHNFTQEEIAVQMGKKQSTIANKLRLLKLSDKVRKLCVDNNLTERHGRALLIIPDEGIQIRIIQEVINNNLNVKQTEELINNELLKISGKQLSGKSKKIKVVIPAKVYVNSIRQVFNKLSVPADFKFEENDDSIEIIVRIPKVKE